MSSDEPLSCGCKIGRDATKYDVPDLPAFVKRRRIEADSSLRELADAANICLVEAVLDRTDADVAGDADSVYAALADEDTPPERRLSVRNQLADVGVTVGELEEDFVSYQAVRLSRHGVDRALCYKIPLDAASYRMEQAGERFSKWGCPLNGVLEFF